VIKDIVNPIQILSDIEQVSTNILHTVVMTKNKRVLAWGRACNFSNRLQGNYTNPVDITEEFG
jgi:alpha-tubulin suppressor-like RCC1 family protein